jgi:hypothetical protein
MRHERIDPRDGENENQVEQDLEASQPSVRAVRSLRSLGSPPDRR